MIALVGVGTSLVRRRQLLLNTFTTGYSVLFSIRALKSDGIQNVPGWRWRFPSHGKFRQFPEKKPIWEWTTDQLSSALEALAKRTLILERVEGIHSETSSSAPEPSRLEETPPIVLKSPENSPIEEDMRNESDLRKSTSTLQGSSEDPGLDDLVTQLKERAQQWKELTRQLERSKQREQDLQASNTEQVARIAELEKKSGVEYILLELGRTRAINEELKATIKNYEDEARDNNWLRERNQFLERKLAEKTAEVDATKHALKTLAEASSHSKSSRGAHHSAVPAASSQSRPLRDPNLSAIPAASSKSKSSRDSNLSEVPAVASHFKPPRHTHPSAVPAASSYSKSLRDTQSPAIPATSSHSKSLRDLHISAVPAVSSNSRSLRDSPVSVGAGNSSSSESSQDPPHLSTVPAATPHLKSANDSHLLAVAAARRISEETTRFLEEKKLEREGRRFESKKSKMSPVYSKRKSYDGEGIQRDGKRRNTALFWEAELD
ncbi:hypothetical protein N431DRAFT_16834 [Stipitochalara longipes BDJ]|nr:hypothetical protein N431DRAFT_16834 [Stipitochalara longipes BDJ]